MGIAAQHPPAGPQVCRFYLLEGSPVDSALAGQLGRLKDILPHPVTNVTWRDLGSRSIPALPLRSRNLAGFGVRGPANIYILIYDIQRFRDLRKSDDDFGYSRYDRGQTDALEAVCRRAARRTARGRAATIIWCDSVNNLNRTLDRQGMKEFENRILFQMSSNDSSTLIDNPAASKVGENRALYYSEEANRTEKFRPYGLPELTWLEEVKKRFAARPRPAEITPGPGVVGNGFAAAPEPAPIESAPAAGNGDASASPSLGGEGIADSAAQEEVGNPPVEIL